VNSDGSDHLEALDAKPVICGAVASIAVDALILPAALVAHLDEHYPPTA
jgi:hypothetical protein